MLVFKHHVEIYKFLETEQTSWLTFGPQQFAESVFTLSGRIPCFIIYLFSPVGCYAKLSIKVPPFHQLIQELLSYSSAASWTMVVSPNWHGPRGARELRMRICKLIQTVVHLYVLSLQSLHILEGKNKQENNSREALYLSHVVLWNAVWLLVTVYNFGVFFVVCFFPCLSSRCFTFCSYWTWIRFSFQSNHGYPVSQMWYSASYDPLWYFGSDTSF